MRSSARGSRLALLFALAISPLPARAGDGPPLPLPTFGEPALDPPPDPNRSRFFAIPNAAYDTDDGLGFGARGELALIRPGYSPYRAAFVVHVFATLKGYMHHRLRVDVPGLGEGGRSRLTVHLAWRQWQNDGYWGIGNTTTRERAYVGDFPDGDPRRKRYNYSLFQPFLHVTWRTQLKGPWSVFESLNLKWSIIQTYEGSLLAEQRPYGMDGGLGLIASAGVLYDSRAPEVNPERGVLLELSGRAAIPGPTGAGEFSRPFGGILFSARGFVTPRPWLTLAGRVMGEALFGDVPFFEMVHWGGFQPVAGFGGAETLRGVAFGRFRAPIKAVANLEARIRMFGTPLGGRPLDWQLGLFGDVGIVCCAPDSTPSGGWPVHPGAGAGLRLVFDHLFVGRFDVAVGADPIREVDGSVSVQPSLGVYIVFDQAF